jgi:hypothetical protein
MVLRIKKPKLAVDLDNTSGDFIGAVEYILDKKAVSYVEPYLESMFPDEDKDRLMGIVQDPATYALLKPFTNAAYVLNLLVNSGLFEFEYVSARPVASEEVTVEWLKRNHFPLNGNLRIFGGNTDKINYIFTTGFQIIIDDISDVLKQLEFSVPHRFLLDRGWNQLEDDGEIIRVKSWIDFYEHLIGQIYGLSTSVGR